MPTSLQASIIALALATTTLVGANEPVSIRVSPTISFAPANLVVQSRVEPDANNRAIEIVVDSERFYRSSTMQLEGDRAPKTTTFEFRGLPTGAYELTASVIGADGRRTAVARARANVIEPAASR